MPASPTRVLITGVQGVIAGAVLADLRREVGRYEVYGVNRCANPWEYGDRVAGRALPQDRSRIADLSDIHAVRRAVEGMDVVLHLGEGGPDAAWRDVLTSNVVGTYNVFEACREASVRRVVYASSAMVCWGYMQDEPYRAIRERRLDDLPTALPMVTKTSAPRPADTYAASKLWGEALGRVYADVHGLSVLCLRFGWVDDQDTPWKPDLESLWCSQRDAAQLVRRCVEAPGDLRFDVFFGVSANLRRWVDIDDARDRVGYAPVDRVEEHRETGPLSHAA
jgi:nucleoside-diphosphate-sugar epimerase